MDSKAEQPVRPKYTLSQSITTPSDVGRLIRELEGLENSLLQLKIRAAGEHIALPQISHRMQELSEYNKLNLLHPGDRHALKEFLTSVKQDTPVMHISFSTEPTEAFLVTLTAWLRREINPCVLFTIGLQPAIGAGCVVRTTNKYFDMSLRQTFFNKRHLLLEQLIPAAASNQPTPAAPAEVVPA